MSKSSERLEELLKEIAQIFDLSSEKMDDDYELRRAEVRQIFELLSAKTSPMNVNIKRLNEHAVIPQYAKAGDSGFDLVATEDVIIEPGETAKVPVGLAFELPTGYELQIRPRSGITSKTKLRVQFGTVDSGYIGEIGVIVDNIAMSTDYHMSNPANTIDNEFGTEYYYPIGTYIIRKGDRIAQGVIAPVATATFTEVDMLSETERGEGGFGSTGVKVGAKYRKESRKLSDYHTETTIYLDEQEAE
jgi:dUTP pyrophosphatase